MVADLDPLGITTSAEREIAGGKRRANEKVTRKYFSFGNDSQFISFLKTKKNRANPTQLDADTAHCFLEIRRFFKSIALYKILYYA